MAEVTEERTMEPGIMFLLAAFAAVVIIVALTQTTRIHDLETQTHHKLTQEELVHRTKMQELEMELERIKSTNSAVKG
jgi:hypothetical protein